MRPCAPCARDRSCASSRAVGCCRVFHLACICGGTIGKGGGGQEGWHAQHRDSEGQQAAHIGVRHGEAGARPQQRRGSCQVAQGQRAVQGGPARSTRSSQPAAARHGEAPQQPGLAHQPDSSSWASTATLLSSSPSSADRSSCHTCSRHAQHSTPVSMVLQVAAVVVLLLGLGSSGRHTIRRACAPRGEARCTPWRRS